MLIQIRAKNSKKKCEKTLKCPLNFFRADARQKPYKKASNFYLRSLIYSHLSNNRGGWNKRGGSAKVAKSINVEVGINVEGGIFWKKLVHKCNKRGVEGGKNLRNQ